MVTNLRGKLLRRWQAPSQHAADRGTSSGDGTLFWQTKRGRPTLAVSAAERPEPLRA
jgi:hypothetical protein